MGSLDVVLDTDSPVVMPEYQKKSFFNSYNLWKRPKAFSQYYGIMDTIFQILVQNPLVNLRYLIAASEKLPSSAIPVFVKPEELLKEFHIGYADGQKAVNGTASIDDAKKMVEDYQTFILRDGF